LRVEHRNYYAACEGSPIKLPRTEFLIFSRLTRTPNRIVAAEELWISVWGTDKPLNPESLHVYMYRLRSKLADFGLQIETMVNVGYRLITQAKSN
jgi:DNA-binding response OmpR family regulator